MLTRTAPQPMARVLNPSGAGRRGGKGGGCGGCLAFGVVLVFFGIGPFMRRTTKMRHCNGFCAYPKTKRPALGQVVQIAKLSLQKFIWWEPARVRGRPPKP